MKKRIILSELSSWVNIILKKGYIEIKENAPSFKAADRVFQNRREPNKYLLISIAPKTFLVRTATLAHKGYS